MPRKGYPTQFRRRALDLLATGRNLVDVMAMSGGVSGRGGVSEAFLLVRTLRRRLPKQVVTTVTLRDRRYETPGIPCTSPVLSENSIRASSYILVLVDQPTESIVPTYCASMAVTTSAVV